MKVILLALTLGVQTISSMIIVSNPRNETSISSSQNIENGWYEASVSYYNPSTFQRSRYNLNVKVEYNRVTVIDFGNGGSVHSGYNNSGYTYYGGSLSFQRNFNGQIISATTRVSVTDSNGTRYFDIEI
ncbi:MAG: hypothetical protein LPJ98_12315 [Cyclobacteriaceae bacterium]|nr:hypothetical protein [Cyclobacteriaceae bacterium]